jgi:hypothetical protein
VFYNLTVDAEELSCKKEALCKLPSTVETSYHAATKQRGDSKQVITAIAVHCHDIHDASRCYWYCRSNRHKS